MFGAVKGSAWIRASGLAGGALKRRISIGVIAIACFMVAAGAVGQSQVKWNELSHFAQVRAFDRGTPIIDRYRHGTGDRAWYHRHFYSDKAPGLALLTLPVYHFAHAAGVAKVSTHRELTSSVHLLVLFGCVIPAAIMLLLVRWLVERHEPRRGSAVAIMLGLGTLLLPFATLFFSHELSTALGFAAFCLLWRERDRGGGLGLVAGAGLLAGLAISTEYPLGVLAVVLGVYAGWREHPVKPLIAYGGGLLAGLLPLLLYDWWAFGSPLHLSYSYVAANSSGVLGLGAPSLRNLVRLLVADRGLFVVSPVVAAGIAGMVILYREGRRADALLPAGVVAGYLGYNACYYLPFGGGVPGPRFLITILPFLALPLAAAFRKAPIATTALATVSAAMMTLATLTGPILDTGVSTHTWWVRLQGGHFTTSYASIAVFGLFVVLAVLAAARATGKPRFARLDLELAVLGLGGWFAVARAGPALLAHDLSTGEAWGLAALLMVVVALAATITRLASGHRLALIAGVPLVALAVRSLDHTALAFSLVAISLGLLVVLARARRVMM
jgi:hypothetical protein